MRWRRTEREFRYKKEKPSPEAELVILKARYKVVYEAMNKLADVQNGTPINQSPSVWMAAMGTVLNIIDDPAYDPRNLKD